MTYRALLLGMGLAWICGAGQPVAADEGEQGWRPLFDGKSLSGWRTFAKEGRPGAGWVVEDGILKKLGGVRGGDIMTTEVFGEFELRWEWKLPARANNGLKYFVVAERRGAIGHEYQLIDDRVISSPKHQTGSFYDVLPPKADRQPPRIGEWNESSIVVRDRQVEHWLNGEKILTYELGSPELKTAVANSKFKSVDGFGVVARGHILLTDHNDEAWYRNLRIRVP